MSTPATNTTEASTLAPDIARLAGVISSPRYPGGDHAALRRWAPGLSVPLAFYRLWLRYLDRELPPEGDTEAWMTIAWGIAISGEGCHDPKHPLGQAFAESGYSEGRLERLLSAPEDVRIDLFMTAVRFLATKGKRFDWREATQFLLTRDADKRENLHRRIASAYFHHLPPKSSAKE